MNKSLLLGLISVACWFVIGCARDSSLSKNGEPLFVCREPFWIGDMVSLQLLTTTTTNRFDTLIGRDGKFDLPGFGKFTGAGKVRDEILSEVQKRLADSDRNIRVKLWATEWFVTVEGSVKVPVRISPEKSLTATEAVRQAGGFNEELSSWKKRRIKIHRDDGEIVTWDFLKATKDSRFDLELRRGDRIVVP